MQQLIKWAVNSPSEENKRPTFFTIKGLINAPHSSQHNTPVITNGARYCDVFGL